MNNNGLASHTPKKEKTIARNVTDEILKHPIDHNNGHTEDTVAASRMLLTPDAPMFTTSIVSSVFSSLDRAHG